MKTMAGSCIHQSSLGALQFQAHGASSVKSQARAAPPPHLTTRQREVLSLLCEGLPNKLICRRLNIAPATVKAHISSILRELGVSSRLQAVVAARRYIPASEVRGGEQGVRSRLQTVVPANASELVQADYEITE